MEGVHDPIEDIEETYECPNCGKIMIVSVGSAVKIKCPKCSYKIEVL